MDLLRHGPWQEVMRLRQDVDRLLEALREPGRWEAQLPRTDVYETDKEVVVSADLPGLAAADDLEVGVSEDGVTIKGEIKRAAEVREEGYTQAERFFGRFSRSLSLPAKVRPEEARATYRNGVLEIRMPKVEEPKKRTLRLPVH